MNAASQSQNSLISLLTSSMTFIVGDAAVFRSVVNAGDTRDCSSLISERMVEFFLTDQTRSAGASTQGGEWCEMHHGENWGGGTS